MFASNLNASFSPKVTYADDVHFISMTEYRDVDVDKRILQPHQLNVNTDKTD